jgi:hypothetical protein
LTTALAVLAGTVASAALDPVFDNRGFSPHREFARYLPFEHFDPLTGNLVLTFTDVVLPGNAGFDLKIQRVYNTKIYAVYSNHTWQGFREDSPAGLGWTMHFGRIVDLLAELPGPTIEMGDGSSQPSHRHINGDISRFITRDFWTFDRNARTLRLPNGVQYRFDCVLNTNTAYATEIRDPFGNLVKISYFALDAGCDGEPTPPSGVQPEAVRRVEQVLAGGGTRVVEFDYTAQTGTLKEMRYTVSGRTITWRYDSDPVDDDHALITAVRPPEGPAWGFTYWPGSDDEKGHLIQKVTTPQGGTVDYSHRGEPLFLPSSQYTPVLARRTTGGEGIPGGEWTYAYESESGNQEQSVKTTVNEPCCRQVVYRSHAIGPAGDENPWRIGALKSKQVIDNCGDGDQTETYDWVASPRISLVPEGPPGSNTHVPLLSGVTTTRGGHEFTVEHSYDPVEYSENRPNNFADFGRAFRTVETGQRGDPGQLVRTIDREFFYPPGGDPSFGLLIVDRTKKETVRAGGQDYVRTWTYDTDDGFLRNQTTYGVVTTFDDTPVGGNVQSRTVTREQNFTTTYTYSMGVEKNVQTPEYLIRREINGNGTIKSEERLTDGQYRKTEYSYDDLLRVTSVDPPEDITHTTRYTYNSNGREVEVKRGPSVLTSSLDGFGRVIGTENAVGIRTDTGYDACSRPRYVSYPYASGTSTLGTDFTYDGLDRITSRRNPDATTVTQAYDLSGTDMGLDVRVEDEKDRVTTYVSRAFGDPRDARLHSVTDAGSGPNDAVRTTTYGYNGLGGLTSVDGPSGPPRAWTYVPNTDRVDFEDHPESGRVDYTYWPDGSVKSRDDEQFGPVSFEYDGNGRVRKIKRPSPHPETTLGYDAWNNRVFVDVAGGVRSDFGPYDSNARLRRRTDRIGGRTFVTRYDYDASDNLQRITYPSGTLVHYFHDAENRVLKVAADAAGAEPYAHTFAYHPSGGVESYLSGNGVLNEVGYHDERYWVTNAKSGGFLDVGYVHDDVGNVTTLNDSRLGTMTLAYDNVDRLRAVTGGVFGGASFTYDAMGNRTQKRIGSVTTNYAYSGTTNRLDTASGSPEQGAFEYDDNGNLERATPTVGPEQVYTYNPENMVLTATVGGSVTRYGYDGDNLRKLRDRGSDRSYFVHGPGNQLLAEHARVGADTLPVREYVYAGTRLLASVKPAVLTVVPDTLAFAAVVDDPLSEPQQIEIRAGNAEVDWTAVSAPWIRLSATAGTTPTTIEVRVDPAGLEVGVHTGTVTVSAPDALGSPRVATIHLAVVPEPGLVVLPRPLRFTATEGDTDATPQTLNVLHAGPPTHVDWEAVVSTPSPWVALSPEEETTPSVVTVTVDPTGLRRGVYRAAVTVTADAEGSPKVVPVELTVKPGPGIHCHPASWYCERFDDLAIGPIHAQNDWSATGGLVMADPRGAGQVLQVDPPSADPWAITGHVDVGEHDQSIDGNQMSLQVMVSGVAPEERQVSKVEFHTTPGVAWGKTASTFGALRLGSKLYLQFGPNLHKVLLEQVENDRWYEVKVVYSDGRIHAYVDGQQRFVTNNPLAGTHPILRFGYTGWDYPGQAHFDLLEGRTAEPGLVVAPQPLRFSSKSSVGGGGLKPVAASVTPVASSIAPLAAGFEENRGQAPPDVRFFTRQAGQMVVLGEEGIGVPPPASAAAAAPLRLRFAGAVRPTIEALEPLPAAVHYLRGNDRSRWVTGARRYGRIRYRGIYPGVDVELYGHERALEYDVIVSPGVDPSVVRLAFEGASDVTIAEDGGLLLRTSWGELRQRAPVVYQEFEGRRTLVAGGYVLDGSEATFRLGDYDPSRELVVDPVLVFSSYMGGAGADVLNDVAVDDDGAIYVAGTTQSLAFATANPVRLGPPPGPEDQGEAFVAKLTPSGSAIEWLTYVGGSAEDQALALAVDGQGRVSVVGLTISADFPTAPVGQVLQPVYRGNTDAIVFRLNAEGNALDFSTFLGGSEHDAAYAIALDSDGGPVVGGATFSPDFPLVKPLRQHDVFRSPGPDGFVSWITPAGTAFLHSTYLGGSGEDEVTEIATDTPVPGEPSRIYAAGTTFSSDFQTHGQVLGKIPFGLPDGFLVRMRRLTPLAGPRLVLSYSTYLGHPSPEYLDRLLALDVDGQGTAHVSRMSWWNDSPFWGTLNGVADGGTHYTYEKFIGVANVHDLSVGPEGFITGAGVTRESMDAAYVFKFDPLSGAVRYSTELGCAPEPSPSSAVAVDTLDGEAFVVGGTGCETFITVDPFQPANAGSAEGFVAKISDSDIQVGMEFTSVEYRTSEAGDGGEPPRVTIGMRRTGSVVGESSVVFRTSNGTATAGQDYVATQVTVPFAPGQTEATVSVDLIDDDFPEQTETVLLQLSDPVGGQLGTLQTATLFIDDDDGLVKDMTIRDRVLPVGPLWSIEYAIPWLSFSEISGVGPSVVTATADPGDRPPGTYIEYFIVTGDTGDSPQVVEAILRVFP